MIKIQPLLDGLYLLDSFSSPFISTKMDEQIIKGEQLRGELVEIIQRVKLLNPTCYTSIARTKLDEAVMWLGENIKELDNPNPYPNSRHITDTTIDPTADGLKF